MSASPWSQLDLAEAAALLSGTTYVQSELVVALEESSPTFADLLSVESAQNAALAGAVTAVARLAEASAGNPALYQLTLSADADFTATLSAISNWTTVEWVTPNFIAAASAGPEANSAPVLTTSPAMTLTAILEDDVNNPGTLISALLATGAGGDPISDADGGALEGIALTGVDTTKGSWQFSLDGGANWSALGGVSTSSARLLASDGLTRIRLVPNANAFGSVNSAITFRAWDQTSGVNGGTASVTTSGGSTAFSTAAATASLTVTGVNDAPSFTKGSNQTTGSDGTTRSVSSWASSISQGPSETGQTLSFLVSNDNASLFSVQPAISSTGTLTYTAVAETFGTAMVSVRLQDSGGTVNGGVDTSAVQTFIINVGAVPSITPIADQTILEDGVTAEILFSVSDADSPLSSISVSTSSTSTTLTPSSGRVLTNLGGGNYRLVITPAANRFGAATITVNASDGTNTGSRTFLLTVNQVNDAPSFTSGGNHGGRADGTAVSTSWATSISAGSNDSGQTVTFLVAADDPSLFAVQPAISPTGTLTYTFQTGATGSTTVRVRLKDDGGTADGGVDTSAEQTFVIRVTEPPTIMSISNRTINEDGYVRVQFSAADADGPLSALAVTHSATGSVVPTTSRILTDLGGGNYELIYVPTPDASGTSTITLRVSDGYATTSTSFTLNVTAINDAPSFVKGADQGIPGLTLQTVNGWATSISAGANETSQSLSFVVTNDNPALFLVQPSISSTGVLTYQRHPSYSSLNFTYALVTVRLTDDGGTANGGVDTSAVQTFAISTSQPTFVPPGTLGMNEDTTAFWDVTIQDLDTPADLLTAVVSARNDAVVLPGGLTFTRIAGYVWRLTATPAPNAYGSATVYIDMTDDRGRTTYNQVNIVVGGVNDAPAFTAGSNLVFSSGTDTRTIAGWATGISAGPLESQSLSFVVFGGDPGLFAVAPAINAAGDLTFTQAAGATGTAVVTVYLTDSGGTAAGGVDTSDSRIFTITLSSPPTVGPISDVTLNEDGSTTVDVFVDDPDTAPAELTLSAVSADGLLLPSGRATFAHVAGNHWRMTLAPAADRFGQSTVTVTAAQGSSASSTTFTLTVTPQNDPPIFTLAQTSLSVLPDADVVRAGWVSGIAAGPNETGQNTTWLVAIDNPSYFAALPTIDADGTLRFRGAGLVGTALVTLRLRDDAGGFNTSPAQIFEVRFTDVTLLAGALDPTFDGDGRQTLGSPLEVQNFARDTALQADGKTIVVGVRATMTVINDSAAANRSFVMRLNVDGGLDTSFGTGGIVTIYNPASSISFQMHAVELTADGKIVVAGNSGNGIYVVRFNTDGTWDETFGTSGATLVEGLSASAPTVGLAIQADGKIVAVRNGSSTTSIGVVRLTADGLLDTTFGTGGQATFSQSTTLNAYDVIVQKDGKIVVGGVRGTGSSSDFAAVRFLTDGTADATFGTGGIVFVNVGTGTVSDTAYRVALQNDGKIVLAGSSGGDIGLVRLTTAGSLDTTFDTDGKKVQSASAFGDTAFALAVMSDGRIVVGGSGGAAITGFTLARFGASGALDTGFGTDGFVIHHVGSESEAIFGLTVGLDGRITAVGRSSSVTSDIIVTRYFVDGTLNPSFGSAGVARFDLDRSITTPNSTLVQSDDRIVVSGMSGSRRLIWRLNADGSFDPTFGSGGYYVGNVSGTNLQKTLLLTDGKLLLFDPVADGLTRLTADGVLDTSFGTNGTATFSSGLFGVQRDATIGADGSIYIAGYKNNAATGFDEFAVVRFTAEGVVDVSFDGDGQALIDVAAANDQAGTVVVQTDGKILVGGNSRVGTTDDLGVVRLNADGTLDTTFSGDGRTVVSLSSLTDQLRDMLVQPDGRIVVVGTFASNVGVARLTSNGELDATFGGDGIVSYGLGQSIVSDAFLQNDGKLLIAGVWSTQSSRLPFVLRLTADGSRDVAFDGEDGFVVFATSTVLGTGGTAAVLQSDGKLLVAVQAATRDDQDLVVLRILTDDDLPVGAAPTIGAISNLQLLEDGSGSFEFTTADPDTRPEFLTFSIASSITAVVNASSFAFTHLGVGVWRATVTPTRDGFGTTAVTLSVTDGMTSSSRTFNVTVMPINDAPRFVIGPDVAAAPGVATVIPLWAAGISPGGVGELGQQLGFLVEVADPSLFLFTPSISSSGHLSFISLASAAGKSTTVTVRLKDMGGTNFGGVDTSASRTFTISFGAVPVIEAIADRTINEGSTLAPVAVIVTDADSPTSSLIVSGISGNPELLSGVTLTNLGTGVWRLTAFPTADRYGSTVITLSVTDGARTSSRSFTLNVTNVNDAPSFVKGLDQYVAAGSGMQTVSHWAQAVSAGAFEGSQNLTFTVEVDDPSLFAVQPTISADGTLTYAAALGKSGTANITVRLQDDGGTAGGGTDTIAAQTFAIHLLTAAPGGPTFDPTFDGDGIAAGASPYRAVESGLEIAIQSDGKVVVVGSDAPGAQGSGMVRRFNADGTADAAFGTNGLVRFDFSTSADIARDVAIGPEGKIYVALSGSGLSVVRLNVDGSLDSTYGVGGRAVASNVALPTTHGLAVQTDGKAVVVGGSSITPFAGGLTAVRFLADGTMDTSFGSGGVFQYSGLGPTAQLTDVVIRPDGRIIASGFGSTSTPSMSEMVVVQLTTAGALDRSFSADGIAIIGSPNGEADTAREIALDGNGRIIVAGNFGQQLAVVRLNVDGTFDDSFSLDGRDSTAFPSFGGSAEDVVILADDRIVAIGTTSGLGTAQILAVRYQAGGTLDSTFDGDGVALLSLAAGNDRAFAAAVRPDGKLLIAGAGEPGTDAGSDWEIAQLSEDGTLDVEFGYDGAVTILRGSSSIQFQSVVRQFDGKYLVSGVAYRPTGTSLPSGFAVARYLADGTLDATFGTNGYAAVGTFGTGPATIALRSDGKILVASAANQDTSVVRLNADGSLDTSFGGDGSIATAFAPSVLLMQGDGKFAIGGQMSGSFAVARYGADGLLDTTFAGTGVYLFTDTSLGVVRALALQADGKIVVLGNSDVSSRDFVVARLNSDGTIDASFGQGGLSRMTLGNLSADIRSVAVFSDGKIIVGGTKAVSSGPTNNDWALVRFNADGSLDTSFGDDGIVTYAPGGGNDTFGELRLQADGKIVAVGSAVNGTDTDTIVVRFNPNGSFDPTFFEDGVLLAPLSAGVDAAQGLTIDPDGRIVVVGYAEVNGRYEGRIIRLLADADESPPTVEGIFVRGSTWSGAYLDHLDTTGHGDAELAGLGFALAAGVTQTTVTLPWNNVNRITVRFDRDVVVESADALLLTNSAGDTIAATSFRYVDARTVEWTVPTMSTSKYLIHVDSSKVTGETGLALDGEWTTSTSTWGPASSDGSGNGTAGGSFNFRVNVLQGDFDSSGAVSFGEIGQARLQLGKTTAAGDFNYRQDYDGSGSITFGEIGQARGMLGTGLSSLAEPPVPPEAEEAFDSFAEFTAGESFVLAEEAAEGPAGDPPSAAESSPVAEPTTTPSAPFSAGVPEPASPSEPLFAPSPATESFVAASIFVAPALVVRQAPPAWGEMSIAADASRGAATGNTADPPILGDLARVRFDRLIGDRGLISKHRSRPTPASGTRGGMAALHASWFDESGLAVRLSARGGDSSPIGPTRPWRRLEKRADSPANDVFPTSADGFLDAPFDAD